MLPVSETGILPGSFARMFLISYKYYAIGYSWYCWKLTTALYQAFAACSLLRAIWSSTILADCNS
eukprot:2689262-Amphidinium_carterae.1